MVSPVCATLFRQADIIFRCSRVICRCRFVEMEGRGSIAGKGVARHLMGLLGVVVAVVEVPGQGRTGGWVGGKLANRRSGTWTRRDLAHCCIANARQCLSHGPGGTGDDPECAGRAPDRSPALALCHSGAPYHHPSPPLPSLPYPNPASLSACAPQQQCLRLSADGPCLRLHHSQPNQPNQPITTITTAAAAATHGAGCTCASSMHPANRIVRCSLPSPLS